MANLSREARVLRFLLEAAPGAGRIKLAKYAYLADLEATRYLGRQITRFRYIRDDHGPFDQQRYYRALDELTASGTVAMSVVHYPNGYLGYSYEPSSESIEYDFSVAEAAILSYVAEKYMSMTATSLCDDVVYQTEPMQDVAFGQVLPMDRVRPASDDDLGFSLERMLAGEASAQAGMYRPLASVIDELHARYRD